MPHAQRAPRPPRGSGFGRSAVPEALEGRRLMAASVGGGLLRIVGTPDDDVITVALNAANPATIDVTIGDETRSFDLARVTRGIRADGRAGDDVIQISGAISLPATLLGGRGEDELTGGAGPDVLTGGAGDDELDGGAGTDRITGGKGDDVFRSTDAPAEITDMGEDDGVRITLAEAPAAVQTAALNLLAGNPLGNLFRESDEGETVFELEWDANGTPNSAKIALDGTVTEHETEIDPATLPAAVLQAVAARYPNGEITEAETVIVPDQPLLYEVEVVNRRVIRELVISPTGEIISDEIEGRVGG